jgi:hypothetical protein
MAWTSLELEADIPSWPFLSLTPSSYNWLCRRPPAWGKLLAIQQALETHDYVLYLDLDLAIMQPMLHLDGFIAQLERSGRDLLVSQDKNGVNTGVMLFRKSEV